jgi:hypothetical protein
MGAEEQLTNVLQARAGSPLCFILDALGPPCLTATVDHPHRLHKGVMPLGIGYGTFVLDHTAVRGFLDAEVQWTRNPSDAAVRRWSPSTAWKKLASKRGACDKPPVWQQFHASRSLPG